LCDVQNNVVEDTVEGVFIIDDSLDNQVHEGGSEYNQRGFDGILLEYSGKDVESFLECSLGISIEYSLWSIAVHADRANQCLTRTLEHDRAREKEGVLAMVLPLNDY
jgi:hypothetical protein